MPKVIFLDIDDTVFDFNEFKTIGRDLEYPHPQLIIGAGYDHNFVIRRDNVKKKEVNPLVSVACFYPLFFIAQEEQRQRTLSGVCTNDRTNVVDHAAAPPDGWRSGKSCPRGGRCIHSRKPFPALGLGPRIVGEVTGERLHALRTAVSAAVCTVRAGRLLDAMAQTENAEKGK